MKKIMFNDKYGLTQAVLDGRKTMTRRSVSNSLLEQYCDYDDYCHSVGTGGIPVEREYEQKFFAKRAQFKIGEVVAIAQSYKQCWDIYQKRWESYNDPSNWHTPDAILGDCVQEVAGWRNKMFVKSELMPHHIKITDIKVEWLQGISDEDCLKEGIVAEDVYLDGQVTTLYTYFGNNTARMWRTPREAFAALIDKVSGKGTWERNPWVFAYSFERVD